MHRRELLGRLVEGRLRNVSFRDFCGLVEGFGFTLDRVRGSHHVYHRSGLVARLVLQSAGGEAKPYQIRQFLALVEEYDLRLEDEA